MIKDRNDRVNARQFECHAFGVVYRELICFFNFTMDPVLQRYDRAGVIKGWDDKKTHKKRVLKSTLLMGMG
ncbi:hypothetical protein IWQ47_004072 [Aquimarina sp. EL_43]|uniref:hypothetical protein n=1 Tax=unclassified Aquimarina TaxID=2627091 RepID=UPI0018CAF6D0|nr:MULTISPECIES: hypothetical protein [unclassified Aquimarina]MBG6132181.1 hypothetical protein [Aquimarina sp. EL_35]MBG6152978.1 hypothetical protein [Aquimarina sp. EL_32]MBG6170985.1 hypothetical protein [Aquimarina sp. EL_43]